MSDQEEARLHRVRWDDVGGRRVRSLQVGRADPAVAPVVLMPGLGALGYLRDTLYGCAARSQSFLVDLPGFGYRGLRPCEPVVPDLADMLTRWIRTVCGRSVVLFGHSTGGQVALQVAAHAPELVSTLVLGGPTFPPSQRTLPALAAAFVRNTRHEPSGLNRVTMPYYRRGGLKAVLRYVRSGQQDAPERTITNVQCPVTVLRGAHDAFSPQEWAASLAESAPDGRLVVMPGAHTFPYRQGGLTAARIAEAARGFSWS